MALDGAALGSEHPPDRLPGRPQELDRAQGAGEGVRVLATGALDALDGLVPGGVARADDLVEGPEALTLDLARAGGELIGGVDVARVGGRLGDLEQARDAGLQRGR